MNNFKQFSEENDCISRQYNQGRHMRFLLWIKYHWLRWRNVPMPFRIVKDEGVPVGAPMDIHHMMLRDMLEHEACGQLTAELLLKGRRINAFSVGNFARNSDMWGKSTIQPRWI